MTGSTRHGAVPAPLSLTFETYAHVREQSLALALSLSDADTTVQSMEDASPAKWHLAHTTWFFETFILKAHAMSYDEFHSSYNFLFNSYYDAVGERHARPRRGMLTRPSLDDVKAYRAHVDRAMGQLFEAGVEDEVLPLVELGLHHEQQHQELLLTDILHLFAQNPLMPAFRAPQPLPMASDRSGSLDWLSFDGGIVEIGAKADGFSFDCEGPRHDVLLRPFELASRAVTNGEWLSFMAAGGYDTSSFWLSDGFAVARDHGWRTPLYWFEKEGAWWSMTLRGAQPVDLQAPVCHVSFYEADAYARYAGARLPLEAEWEHAASAQSVKGNFADQGQLRPRPQMSEANETGEAGRLHGLYGDVWEWTASAYAAYPGFRPVEGAVGEYNGKFMSGQMVLRGGSCATPAGHMRASYRNFFHPDKRWQFSGLRLARDLVKDKSDA
ncbi:MAG: ergothioneine biosynthesis protein EgtB [Parvibaculum sp.]